MAKRFYYFDFNGRGESIRYMLHYGEVKFEDVRYTNGELASKKASTPFGQLPMFEDGDKGTINQSLAIAKYVGQSLNLVAGNPFKDAQLDATALTIMDFWTKVKGSFLDPSKSQEEKDAFLKETLEYYFSRFEKQLLENNGFFGGKLTWVDFVLVGIIETGNLYQDTHMEANYPTIQALLKNIHSYPGVKKYVASRKPYVNTLKK